MQPLTPTHPVEFDVDYPDRQLDRVSTLLRIVYAIPILILLAVLGGPALDAAGDSGGLFFIGLASGLIVVPPLLTIVFRQKCPRWWFEFNLAFLRFDNRVSCVRPRCQGPLGSRVFRASGVDQGGASAARRRRTTLTNPRAGADLLWAG